MGKGKDIGWKHGELVNSDSHHWKCNYCGITRCGDGVLRLKQHLEGQGRDVVNCSRIPNAVRQKMQLHYLNAKRKCYRAGHGEHLPVSKAEDGDGEFLIYGHSECAYKYFHKMCLQSRHITVKKEETSRCWYCPSCLCRSCLRDEHDELTVLCDGCDDAYHIYCMTPSHDSIPEGIWYCGNCKTSKEGRGIIKSGRELQQAGWWTHGFDI
ncbi:Lysine-specific demethylase 5C [Carex littledalei]|uniref:Lysine-specific demethylase 5C n=1 Tax=Carex littledalei TaxID=544730 RepID=A0A833QXB6_9POAL|nr:Lysine-specific demethylase 5C [Carex littledalei]